MLKLAERCEQATGPDRELDRAIERAVGWARNNALGHEVYGPTGRAYNPRRLTASLDAAMTLVPEGYDPLIDYTGVDTHGGKKVVELYYGLEELAIVRAAAATGPLALCAAALRARASAPDKGGR
jgi:hypothetical protein